MGIGKNNMPWFNDYYKRDGKASTNDDLINYLLASDYSNRVGSFYLLHYKIYLNHLKEYTKDALKIKLKKAISNSTLWDATLHSYNRCA
jgi:hypothetical protein